MLLIHHWVELLVGFTLSIEYHKGWDNAASDSLSQVTSAKRCNEHRGEKGYPLREEKADAIPRSPLPLPHTGWWIERSFAVCSPQGSINVTEMLDTKVSSELCTYYRTGSGSPTWLHRCRKQLATVNNASNTKELEPKCQCSPSLPLLLWSCYTWISQALRWLWS